jgi:hypothetical protein
MPSRGIACLPIAPSRHGLSVRVFALASLSPSAHSHRVTIPLMSRPCIALPFAPPTIANCCAEPLTSSPTAKLIRSLPIKALRLPLQCFSNLCRAPCLTNQCQALAQPCRASRHNALTSLCSPSTQPRPCVSLPFGPLPQLRRTLQFFSLPRPCGSSPSRSGLYRHGVLQPTAVLFTLNSYPRNPIPPHLIFNHINALPSHLLITA